MTINSHEVVTPRSGGWGLDRHEMAAFSERLIQGSSLPQGHDKKKVFKEAYRVLKPGGRLMVSDIVLLKELPTPIRRSLDAYVGCITGALLKEEYLAAIEGAGFQELKVIGEDVFPIELVTTDPVTQAVLNDLNLSAEQAQDLSRSVASIKVSAIKPG